MNIQLCLHGLDDEIEPHSGKGPMPESNHFRKGGLHMFLPSSLFFLCLALRGGVPVHRRGRYVFLLPQGNYP